ncbi:small ribosomal subunit protein bS1m-like [Tubulanus polymorphus]|uniref:small ribosomal subunit protein bS1m-like n=1 Tax=Tubulanus polymorphus TaxID=672921 RepID=UPI003DA3D5B7
MAAPMKIIKNLGIFRNISLRGTSRVYFNSRLLSNSSSGENEPRKVGGFAEAVEKFEQFTDTGRHSLLDRQDPDFETLLKNSQLFKLGDVEGRIVIGQIKEIVNDDLYIDFGGKFHCVCKRPKQRSSEFHRGAQVRLKLHDLELTKKFLGSEKHITLLEADATLLGLYKKPSTTTTTGS